MYNTLIDAQALKRHLKNPDWVIVDTRSYLTDHAKGRELYLESHIPGAYFLDMENDLSGQITAQTGRHPLPEWNTLMDKLSAMGIHSDSQVVVYDDMSGAMAGRLWWLLRYLGHEKVAVLDGGIKVWAEAELGLSVEPPELKSASPVRGFKQSEPLNAFVSTKELSSALNASLAIQLVDARAAARFAGEVEPIDPIAGHVPGALNRAFDLNLNEDGVFKTPDQLKQEWLELIDASQTVIHMCGSGVTACHNMLAMEHAGLNSGKLYAGSWSEWIRESDRPVATLSD